MSPRNKLALALLFAALLVTVSMVVAPLSRLVPSQGAPESVSWPLMNANADATNFVQQSQITEQNVGDLSLKWTFPFPTTPSVPGLAVAGAGAISPPLVVNGTVYVVTNFLDVYAINAGSGQVLWTYQPVLNTTGLPLGPLTGHIHGINYYHGDVWVSMPDCSAYGLNATTGVVDVKVSDICANIPGNSGLYAAAQEPPTFDKSTMIWTSAVSEGTDVGRGFVAAYDVSASPANLLWRWYVTPGAGGNPNWDTVECPPTSCHGNVAPVAGDWGAMGYGGKTMAGAGPSFGDPVVDATLGVVYVSTSQPSPDWNGTYRPGPDLYSDSVVALNVTNGQMLWYYQTTPHDLFDFDCGWNTVLGSVAQNGSSVPAVFKSCKNGYVYALDALSGKLLWYFAPPSLIRIGTSNANYVVTGNYSADLPWINYPSTSQFTQCPGTEGGSEADIALAYGMVYVAEHNYCSYGQVNDVQTVGSNVWGVKYLNQANVANTTIYAIDADSGKQVWSYFLPSVPFRGWLTASGGMVFAGSIDGNVHVLDAKTGAVVANQYLGTPLYESPTIGSTASGQVYLFQLTGSAAYSAFSTAVPGSLIAFAPAAFGSSSTLDTVQLAAAVALWASSAVLFATGRWRRGAYA